MNGRYKTLLIEDNPGDVHLIREMLAEARGALFDLECADRLSAGLERLAEGDIDVVLLDLGLPESQGLDTCARVQAQAPGVPIVVLTGLDDEVMGLQAVEAGAQDYLVKGQVDSNPLARALRYAVERKRAKEALRQRNRELALLNRLGQELSATFDLQQLAERLLQTVMETIGAEAVSVWLWDEGRESWLVCQAAFPPDQNRALVNLHLPPGQGIAGWVAREEESTIVTNVQDDPRFFPGIDEQTGFHTTSLLAVPLRARGKVIGVLEVVNKRGGDFNEDNRALVEMLAASAAIAIDNARLYVRAQQEIAERQQVEERLEHLNAVLHAIRNVNRLVAKETDRDRLLQGACDNFIQTRGYHSAWIAVLDKAEGPVTTVEAGLGKEFLPIVERLERGELTPCARRALAQSGVLAIEDPLSTCTDCPLAEKYGDRGAMAVRLEHSGKTYGLLVVSIPRSLVVDKEEHSLFIEAVEDIAFALYSLEVQAERKQAEEALRESEKKYRLLVESLQEGIWRIDRDAHTTFVNSRMAEMLGYTVDEMQGRHLFSFMDERGVEIAKHYLERRKQGIEEQHEFEFLRKDGTRVYALLATSPTTDDEGNYIGAIAGAQDITKRKQAEEALRDSEERFRTIVETAPSLLIITDAEGNNLYVSPNCEEITGYTQEELQGRMVWWVHEDDTPRAKEIYDRTFREGVGGKDLEYKAVKKNGELWYASSSWEPFRDAEGRLQGVVFQTTDITKRKRLEEQLLQAQKMEAVGRLTGGIAHDFNNLLTVIIGFSELLLHRHLDEHDPLYRPIEEIQKAGKRAASLTGQLLAFSRKQVLQPRVLDLNAVVADMDKMLHRLIGEDIDLVTLLASGLGAVKADPGQLEQVIVNLAINARDAMPQGGQLTIETADAELDEAYARQHIAVEPGPYVMLAVSDTGVGMDEETQSHIFEPFFTTKEKGEGTGLGLATVYGIVKQSGGYIWFYSEMGQGTTFKVYLPRVEGAVEPLRPSVAPTESLQGSETILVVEDDEGVRTLVHDALEMDGYNMLEACDGQEALRVCEEHEGPIHLMVTDVVMPGISGRQLAERLKPLYPEMKVLYISGYTDKTIVRHGVLEPGLAFLQKPFPPGALARKVREVLDAPQENV